jgi:adenylate kinase
MSLTGTQCERLSRQLHYAHFSVGDLLRDEVRSQRPQAATIEELMKEGKLIPVVTLFHSCYFRSLKV